MSSTGSKGMHHTTSLDRPSFLSLSRSRDPIRHADGDLGSEFRMIRCTELDWPSKAQHRRTLSLRAYPLSSILLTYLSGSLPSLVVEREGGWKCNQL
jgi:hypothetical protein